MTQVIDERVVEMRFDNKDFEKNVSQSMSTLDKLKAALNFDNIKPLENLSKNMGKLDISGVSSAVDEVSNKFSVMEIAGITAIAKITSAAMDMGISLAKSLSVDQVSAGFSKYADKTAAVQTIMASTSKYYDNQVEQMKDINDQMAKLMWYTDETSYNFVDMVGNIGKFTSNNLGLEESVTAMQGIANWAAKSGQNAQTASRAMYNIAQAMGVGSMKVQDWKSIEIANMATAEFKETAIETAVQLGKLRKVADGLYETLDGKEVTVETFREQLKSGWFDKEVMMETFQIYGRFTDTLYELSEASGKSATDLLIAAENYQKGILDINAYSEETGISVQDLTAAFEELNSETNKIGNTAFRNAQEAKTFMEVIDSVKDAVSTKWSETFELIFGNYLEAKKLWTGLANDLWNLFAASGDTRNEILGFWKDLGGRTELIKGLISAVNLLVRPLSMVKQAFGSLFPDTEGMGKALYNITVRFHNFMEELQPSEETMNDIYWVFRGVFSVLKAGATIISRLVGIIIPINRPIRGILDVVIHLLSYVGKFLYVISELITSIRIAPGLLENIKNALSGVAGVLLTLAGGALSGLLNVISLVGKGLAFLVTKIVDFVNRTHPLQTILNGLTIIFQTLGKVLVTIGAVMAGIVAGPIALIIFGISKLATAIGDFIEKAKPIESIGNFFETSFNKISDSFSKLKTGSLTSIDGIRNGFNSITKGIKQNFVNALSSAITNLQSGLDKLGVNSNISSAFVRVSTNLKSKLQALKDSLKGTTKEFKNQDGQIVKVTEHTKKMNEYYAGANEVIAQSGTLTRETAAEVKKSTTIWQRFLNIFKNAGKVILAAGTLVISIFTRIGTVIANFFTKAFGYVKDVVTGAKTIREVFGEIFTGLGNKFQELGEKIRSMLEYFGIDWDKIKEGFKELGTYIADFIKGIDAGKIKALAFSAVLISIAGAGFILSDSIHSLVSGVSTFFSNINKILKKQFFKATPITDWAKAFAMIAASLTLLTLVDQTALKNVSNIMLKLMAVATAFSVILTIIAARVGDEKLSKNFETNVKLITSLASAILILSAAMAILSKVKIIGDKGLADSVVEWIGKLIVIFVALAEMAVVAGMFQKLAPKLTLSIWSFAALAAAFAIIAHSLKDLNEIKVTNVTDNLWQISAILAAFGVILAGVGQVRPWTALSVILLANAIKLIMPILGEMIKAIVDSPLTTQVVGIIEERRKAAYAISAVLAAFGYFLGNLGKMSKIFASIGFAAVALAGGVWILVQAINSMVTAFKSLTPSEMQQAAGIIIGFTVAMGAILGAIMIIDSMFQLKAFKMSDKDNSFKMAGQKFVAMGVAMIALAASVHIMVSALKKIGDLTKEFDIVTIWSLVGILSTLTLAFGAAIGLVGIAARGKHAIGIILSMLLTLGLMVAGVVTLGSMIEDNPSRTIVGLLAMIALLGTIALVFSAIADVRTDSASKAAISLFGMLSVLIGGFAIIAELSHSRWSPSDMIAAGVVITGLSAVLLAIIGITNHISKKSAPTVGVDKILKILKTFVISLGGLVVAIAGITKVTDVADLALSSAIIAAIGTVLVALTAWLNRIAKTPAPVDNLNNTLKLYKTVVISIGVLAAEMAAVAKFINLSDMKTSAIIFGGIGVALLALTSVLSWISHRHAPSKEAFRRTIATYIMVASSIALLGIELGVLSRMCNELEMANAAKILTGMGVVTIALTAILSVLTRLKAPSKEAFRRTMLTLVAVVASMVILGTEIGVLVAKTDVSKLGRVARVLTMLTLALEGLTSLLLVITRLANNVNLQNALKTVGALTLVLIETGVLTAELLKLANCDPDKLTTAGLVLGGVLAVTEVMTGVLLWASNLSANILGMVGTLLTMAVMCGEIYVLGEALSKIAQFDASQIKQAGDTLREVMAAVMIIVELATVINAVFFTVGSGAALIGLVGTIISVLLAIGLLAAAGSACEKAGIAMEKLGISLATLENINFAAISDGFTLLGNSADDLKKFADTVGEATPKLAQLDELNRLLAQGTALAGGQTGGVSAYEGLASGIATVTENYVEMEKAYGDIVTEVQSGTITIEDETTALADTIETQTEHVGGLFDKLKEKAGSFADYWKNKWQTGTLNTVGNDVYDAIGLSDDTQFAIQHPLINGVINTFKDPAVQSQAGTAANGFGKILGTDIVSGIVDSLNGNLPGVMSQLQSMFGGVFTFGSGQINYSGWIREQISASEDFADVNNGKVYPSLMRAREGFDKASEGLSEYQQKAGSPALSKATQMQNEFNRSNTTGAKIMDGLSTVVESAKVKVEDYIDTGKEVIETAKKATDANTDLGGSFEEAGGKAGKGAKGLKDFADSLKSTLESQMDIFSKFELKTEVSAETMLENMRSNVDAYASWSHRMSMLSIRFAEQGIDQGLLGKLAEMGPKGYETMNAFYQMTDEQLREAGLLYQDSMVVQDAALQVVTDSYRYCGEMATQGWSEALMEHIGDHAAVYGWAEDQLAAFKEKMGIASPSTVFMELATFCLQGFMMGLLDPVQLGFLRVVIETIANYQIINTFQTLLTYDVFYTIGYDAMSGLRDGIVASGSEAITEAQNIANQIIEIVAGAKGFDEGSPSKVMRRIGVFAGQGLALGIASTAESCMSAAQSVVDGTIETMSGIGRIQDVISTGIDLNPTITPMLDLSYLQSQVEELDSMLSDKTIGADLQNEGTSGGSGQTINYTQNNYSPKSLSRYEIYRQTNRQLSSIRKVVRG